MHTGDACTFKMWSNRCTHQVACACVTSVRSPCRASAAVHAWWAGHAVLPTPAVGYCQRQWQGAGPAAKVAKRWGRGGLGAVGRAVQGPRIGCALQRQGSGGLQHRFRGEGAPGWGDTAAFALAPCIPLFRPPCAPPLFEPRLGGGGGAHYTHQRGWQRRRGAAARVKGQRNPLAACQGGMWLACRYWEVGSARPPTPSLLPGVAA